MSARLQDAAAAALHAEPANALSLPTWVIHVASGALARRAHQQRSLTALTWPGICARRHARRNAVAEWVIAMDLVWKYGDATGRPEWKGLTWGMLPLHGSSLCACTYHFFYNPPALNLLVTVRVQRERRRARMRGDELTRRPDVPCRSCKRG